MSKNVVICCDGTCNQFGSVNTNVVRLFQAIERYSGEQMAFYDPGVGTFAARFLSFNVGEFLGKLLGAAFGYGVKANMETCYRYLMDTYEQGDRVFIFGFSRGAFTARSLASMLDKCGLLHPRHQNLIPYMSQQYFGSKPAGEVESFKRTFCRECSPYFVGVWDTVGSLGLFLAMRQFANNKLSPKVKYAFHALSIDEKRRKFMATPWDESNVGPGQTIKQVWYAGVHCDVGGGYRDHSLANIPFLWMADHARQCGLRFLPKALDGIVGDPLGKIHNSYTWKWKILGSRRRHIPADAQISPSVWTREEDDPTYRPPNLPPRHPR